MQRKKSKMLLLMGVILLLVAISFVFLKKYWVTDFKDFKVWEVEITSTNIMIELAQNEEEPVQESNHIMISIDDDAILWDIDAPIWLSLLG